MKSVGIIGASGFAGAELMRLCAQHPEFEVEFASGESQAGVAVGELYPSLAASYPDLSLEPWEAIPSDLDVIFLALTHGASQAIVPKLNATHILDLGADFRLSDPITYSTWYGQEHSAPELLDHFVYGLPELFREQIIGASAVAIPGCYVTTASLTLAPLLHAGLLESTGIVVDAASGVSGAGRAAHPTTTFSTVDGNFTAYKLLTHRHTPEMQMALERHSGMPVELLFTPHLAPMNRGILATCYARPTGTETTDELLEVMASVYADEPFVVISEAIPSTKAALGSNTIHLTVRRDDRTGWVVAIGALDNLMKGASGQAIQCANLATGINEAAGLPTAGVYP